MSARAQRGSALVEIIVSIAVASVIIGALVGAFAATVKHVGHDADRDAADQTAHNIAVSVRAATVYDRGAVAAAGSANAAWNVTVAAPQVTPSPHAVTVTVRGNALDIQVATSRSTVYATVPLVEEALPPGASPSPVP